MNFLAHSAFAYDDPALLVGQFAGDFVRGADLSAFPSRVASGIRLHRRIDAVTDAHPAVVAARRGFDTQLRRHAGIVIDVIFDHLLASQWPEPQGRNLLTHSEWVNSALSMHVSILPPGLERFRRFMLSENVLAGNADAANVATTLQRISERSPAMAPLALAAPLVEPLAERLREPFAELWPTLQQASDGRLAELLDDEPAGQHGEPESERS